MMATIPPITPILPEWLEKAEKYDSPPDGVECRAVVFAGKTWYLPLTREDYAQRERDAEMRRIKLLKEWAKWDAWNVLTMEEKIARLGPKPPSTPRPPQTRGDIADDTGVIK